MKCEYCGGNLSLEDEICPHCGRVNEQARQHIQAMKHYNGEFKDTKEDVYEVTQKYTHLTVRMIAIAVLSVLIVLVILVGQNAYSIKWDLEEMKSKQNYKEYSQVLDEFLEEENYLAISAFCQNHNIYGYDEPYTEYGTIIRAADSYRYVYYYIMHTNFLSQYDDRSHYIELTADWLDMFYEAIDVEYWGYNEGEDSEKTQKAIENMKKNVELLLITYCNLSPEDAENVSSMSKSKRAVLIEEMMSNEE